MDWIPWHRTTCLAILYLEDKIVNEEAFYSFKLTALEASEALNVIDHLHGRAATALAHHFLATFVAHTCKDWK